MHHQTRPSLAEIMACRLFGAKPLSKPILDYCQTYFSEILIKIQLFSLKKMYLKMSFAKWRPSCLGLNVLNKCNQSIIHPQYLDSVGFARQLMLRYLFFIRMFIGLLDHTKQG